MAERMALTEETGDSGVCRRPELNRSVPAYCFGDATDEERLRFEAHLLECDFCWAEVQRLDEAIRVLRADRSLTRSVFTKDIAAAFGLSAKLRTPFGGHMWHALIASTIYASLYTVALPLEVAYRFDQFGAWSLRVAPLVFVWILATTLVAIAANWKAVLTGRQTGLLRSVSIATLGAAALYLSLKPFLPAYPITEASFQTYTVQSAYLKSVYYFLPFAAVFLFLPFSFVLAMQRELEAGRHRLALDVLTSAKSSVPPRGTIQPRFWALVALMTIVVVVSIIMATHLLDNLKPGPYMNLFVHLLQVRWCLYLALGLECLAWYYMSLTELKRECLAVQRLSQGVRERGK